MVKNSLSSIIVRIKEKDLINKEIPKFERTGTFHQLKIQIKNIFEDALTGIKPVSPYNNVIKQLENWSGYNSFNYKRYFKEADTRFFQLKKRLARQHINLILEYNMNFNQMWLDFTIDLNKKDEEDDALIFWAADLKLDNFFHKEILDMIFMKLNVYPFMMQLCIPQLSDGDEMKAWSANWDT
jgi:hypothetical protein